MCAPLVALLALAGGASASHESGPGQGSPRDFAVGTGENQIGRVSFAAHGGPTFLEEPVTGHFHAKGSLLLGEGEFDLEGPVTCLTVATNPVLGVEEAGLFYPVRNPDPGEPNGVFVFFRDNGNPASGDPPDQIGFVPDPIPVELQPPACFPVSPLTIAELDHGNITIHDAE
jgi:hypothetical protein